MLYIAKYIYSRKDDTFVQRKYKSRLRENMNVEVTTVIYYDVIMKFLINAEMSLKITNSCNFFFAPILEYNLSRN